MQDENTEPTPEPNTESIPPPAKREVAAEPEGVLIKEETTKETPATEVPPSVVIENSNEPKTVTISEVMTSPVIEEKIETKEDQRSFLASLLPKLRKKLSFRTDKRLSKIMELARAKGEIRNDDVEKLLHVSDATASRYLKKLS